MIKRRRARRQRRICLGGPPSHAGPRARLAGSAQLTRRAHIRCVRQSLGPGQLARGPRRRCYDVVAELVVKGRLTERPGGLRLPWIVLMGGAEVVERGSEMAASVGGGGHMIASQADREQVLDALKAAFVQGRLTKDELDRRVGHVLATYAELDALTADLPAAPIQTRLPEAARESHNRKVIQRGTAAGAGGSMAFAAAMIMVAAGSPAVALIVVPVVGFIVAVVLQRLNCQDYHSG